MLSNHADYAKFTDAELEASLTQVEVELKSLSNTKKQIVESILVRKRDEIEAALKAKDQPYGVVHIGNFEINFSKKVTWNQTELANLAQQIMSAGEDPKEYMTLEYGVSENSYKGWPSPIRSQFTSARTVSRGHPTVKVKGDKE